MKKLIGILLGLGIVALVVAPLLYFTAWSFQSDIEKYKKEGMKREARIVETEKRLGNRTQNYYLKLSYFDASITEGGEFYMESVQVNAQVWKQVKRGEEIDILILNEKPEKPMLVLSTHPENFVPFEQYISTWVTLGIAVFLISTAIILSTIFKIKIDRSI